MADSTRAAEPTLQRSRSAFEQLCGALEGNDAALKLAHEWHQAKLREMGNMRELVEYNKSASEKLRMQQAAIQARFEKLEDKLHQLHQANLTGMGKMQESHDLAMEVVATLQQKVDATQGEVNGLKDDQELQELETLKNRALTRRSKELKHTSHSGFLIFIIQIAITITQIVALCYLFRYMRLLPKTSDTSDRAAKISTVADVFDALQALGLIIGNWHIHKYIRRFSRKKRSLPDEPKDEFSPKAEQRLEELKNKRANQRRKKDSADAEEMNFQTGHMTV